MDFLADRRNSFFKINRFLYVGTFSTDTYYAAHNKLIVELFLPNR